MDFAIFVTGHTLSIVPALWLAGWLLRRSSVTHALIPFILAAAGVAAALIIDGPSANSAAQGLLAASAAVMGHQLVRQGRAIVSGAAQDGD